MLGAVLVNPKAFNDLQGLKPDHFFKPGHAKLYSVLQGMYNDDEPIDAITVYAKLKENRDLNRLGGAPYLADLMQAFKSIENVSAYAEIVIDKWRIREINGLGQRFIQISDRADDIPGVLEQARQFLDAVDESAELDSVGFRDLYELWALDQADDRPVIETPWHGLNDRISGGLQRKRMYFVAARPGCGKTIMAAQMALEAAQAGHKTMFFSLELSKEDLMGRMLACGSRSNYNEITRKRMSAETLRKVSGFAAATAELPLQVDDRSGLTIEDIMAQCRIKKQRDGLDFVAIDYLQLVPGSHGRSQVEEIDHIAVKARHIAKSLDCVVVAAVQLNRAIEDSQGRPRLPRKSDLRGAGGLEQTADVIIALSRPVDDNGDEADGLSLMDVSLIKNRTGCEDLFQLRERFDLARFD